MFKAGTIRVSVVVLLLASVFASAYDCNSSDFATELVSFRGPFGANPYDDPNSVLGKPTTKIYDWFSFGSFSCSLVYGSFGTDPNGGKLVTTLGENAEIVVKFDHKVADDPCNSYGIDFIVFGNSFFENGGYITPQTDMEDYYLTNPASVNREPVIVSVSQDGNDWYTYSAGPYADTTFPTNAYAWDRENHCWGKELAWTKPVDPNLKVSDFDGLSVAEAIDLYDGSAGGTGFDLEKLDPNDYEALRPDANSGRRWIRYIKVQSGDLGEIDGFADVSCCGDYRHRRPVGDINGDCRVDYEDLEILCGYWLDKVSSAADPAVKADIYKGPEDTVNFRDLALLTANWQKCSWGCDGQ